MQPSRRGGTALIAAAVLVLASSCSCDFNEDCDGSRQRDRALQIMEDAEDPDRDPPVDVDQQTFCGGDTALLFAVRGDDVTMIDDLIEAGADVDAPSSRGDTPVAVAAGDGHDAALARLLDAGADPDLTAVAASNDWLKQAVSESTAAVSPLLRATVTGEVDAVVELLQAGASTSTATSVDVRLARGMLLVVAASEAPGATDTVPIGAEGSEPLDRLLERTGSVSVDALLAAVGQHASLSALERLSGETPPTDLTELDRSSSERWLAIATQLLEFGAPPDGADGVVVPPLYLAARFGDQQLVALLLEAGADPTIAVDGWTPLDAARYGGWSKVVELLER